MNRHFKTVAFALVVLCPLAAVALGATVPEATHLGGFLLLAAFVFGWFID